MILAAGLALASPTESSRCAEGARHLARVFAREGAQAARAGVLPPVLSTHALRQWHSRLPRTQGWSLVVKPSSGAHQDQATYVADPSGAQRTLSPSEKVYIDRMKPRRRRKLFSR